ncbi:hypothetical protein KOR34_17650 [Posidoniimonas corsicana]|uniref:LamG-like jellyroll fold domain-containing protein n=1 Tax=Posidoniimonas corsicana TaxID=1938618 RepID=A0A5C5VFX7_9BACT|nr:LamG-like jellyroll fold domain-containing protein [Posidoniimonas corsicana]TWT36820.1 hypothetical protein KOR34_17650 [Posidoniimonas corsicana]
MRYRYRLALLLAVGGVCWAGQRAAGQSYRVERVASGLQQPVYMDQAPGDPSNIIYYMTRTTMGGANAGNGTHGSLWRYDMNTRAATEVLNLSHRSLTLDLGPQGFAFHPDFNNPGTDGYQKIYVSSAATGGPVNYVEEYAASGPGGTVPTGGGGLPVVSRTLLEYTNVFGDNNHVVDWIGFDPRAYEAPIGSPERNYLYISAGDGSNGRPADQRPEQKSDIVQGKLLRIDVDPNKADFYPADPQKNFAIPDTNPIPLWNATHDANNQLVGTTLNYTGPTQSVSYSPALPELYFTGTRNTFRMSIDRQTGDFWSGDVGEIQREEINFLPADPYDGSQVPYDFGFPQVEGTGVFVNRSNGDTSIQWDLSGGGSVTVDSVNPIQEGPHGQLNVGSTAGDEEIRSTPRSAYIGGYVYRGPIQELQGKYFYSDFVQGNIFSLDFDTSTPIEDFSGSNQNLVEVPTDNGSVMLASLGTREVVLNRNLNSLWHTLMVDPQDPTYTPALGDDFGIGRVVSFGEDNAGNLYIIDMGGQRGNAGFGNDYPGGATGQIFRVVPNLQVFVTVDRVTGALTFSNEAGEPVDVLGYQVTSGAGALNPDALTPITGRLDNSGTGSGEVDGVNAWEVTSAEGDNTLFSEASTGTAASLAAGQSFALSPAGGWVQSIYEDLILEVTLDGGATVQAQVAYVGNSGAPFDRGDLDFDGALDPDDWNLFRSNFFSEFDGLTVAESYGLGDLDGDGDNDHDDFLLFKADYTAANGAAAFAGLLQAPEPGAALLASVAVAFGCARRRRQRSASPVSLLTLAVAAGVAGLAGGDAEAALTHQYTFNSGLTDSVGGVDGQAFGAAAVDGQGKLSLPGGSGDYVGFDASQIGISSYTDLTIETWFTADNHQTWARLFDYGDRSVANEGYVYYSPQSGLGGNPALARFTTQADITAITSASPPTGVQHHLAFVIDDNANGGADQFSVYLNGVLAGTTAHNKSLSDVIDTNAFLGRSTFVGNDPFFDGSIDEFRIYDHALSASEVDQNFLAGPTPVASMVLYVNTISGDLTLSTTDASPVSIDYYAVRSAAGALSTTGWVSLDDQGLGAGAGPGQGWEEADLSDPTELGELYLLGTSPVAGDAPLPLGAAYDPSVFGAGAPGDLIFEFGLQGAKAIAGQVVYVARAPGDYNNDGATDAADYTVWRDSLGATGLAPFTSADGNGDGRVTQEDYAVWRDSYGLTAAGAAAQAAPEPMAAGLTALMAISFSLTQRTRVGC